MRVLLQRVSSAQVTTESGTTGSISTGLLLFLAIAKEDTQIEADYLLRKSAEMRIFPDSDGKLNRNIREAGGALLIVSQFTLYADCTRGPPAQLRTRCPAATGAPIVQLLHFRSPRRRLTC